MELWHILVMIPSMLLIGIMNIVIHELGHAFAAAWLTKQRVAIYLGATNDKKKGFRFSVWRFDVWVMLNVLMWKGGRCMPAAKNISGRDKLIYILAGPAATLLLAVVLFVVYLNFMYERPVSTIFLAGFLFAAFIFIYNIVPRNSFSSTTSNTLVYNDGTQIKKLLAAMKLPPEYHEAAVHFGQKRYAEATEIFERIIDKGTKNMDVYRAAINANIYLKKYEKADELLKQQVAKNKNLNSHDRINIALLKTLQGQYEESVSYHKQLLKTEKENKYTLNNLGYTLTMLDRHEEAIGYLDKAIAMDNGWAFPYGNRGYARVKLGQFAGGKEDIEYAIQLDNTNAYGYRNLGIYYYEVGQYAEALQNLEKAKEMDPDMPLLDKYMTDTLNKME